VLLELGDPGSAPGDVNPSFVLRFFLAVVPPSRPRSCRSFACSRCLSLSCFLRSSVRCWRCRRFSIACRRMVSRTSCSCLAFSRFSAACRIFSTCAIICFLLGAASYSTLLFSLRMISKAASSMSNAVCSVKRKPGIMALFCLLTSMSSSSGNMFTVPNRSLNTRRASWALGGSGSPASHPMPGAACTAATRASTFRSTYRTNSGESLGECAPVAAA
jgi:hypothetical protein